MATMRPSTVSSLQTPNSHSYPSPRAFPTPLRRSARLNPPPTTYTDPLDIINGGGPKVSPPSTPSSKRKDGFDASEPRDPKCRRQSGSTDDLFSSRSTPKRRRTKCEKTPSPEELGEAPLRRICEGLGIEYSLFDDWVEDPRGRKLEDMNIPFLPNEVMLQVFSDCRPEVLVECMKASKRFWELLNGNTRIWRQARRNHYPGLPIELPLDFDEYELFDMTTGKKCDYCDTKKKVRPYYIWGVRCCQECIHTLTLCATEFKRMLKRKVGDSSDWDAHKRELICYTIKWQDLPTGARLCWKEEAYARINEAEEVMLEDKFEKWVQGASIRREQRETYWILEDWGADVPRMMKKDRDEVRNRVIKARKDLYLTWCQKVLPNPIHRGTMDVLPTYTTVTNKPGFLTKKEFILSLSRLIRDSIRFDDEARRHKALERQSRLKHEDLLEETVRHVIHALIRDSSANNWGNIIREQVKVASAAKIGLRYPKDTPESVMREWGWRCNDLGITLLYRFAKLLEQALDCESSPYRDFLHPSVFEFFENENDRMFTCHGVSMQFSYIGPTFHRCKHKEQMTLVELAQHFVEKGIIQGDLTHLIVGKWEYMIKTISPPGHRPLSHHHNRNMRAGQHKITQWLQVLRHG